MSLERNMTYSAPPAIDAYSGVLSRRVLAFIFDYIVIAILWVPAAVLLFFVGIATLGLAFFLYPVLYFIVAALYFGFSLGGSAQASPGRRLARRPGPARRPRDDRCQDPALRPPWTPPAW